MHSLAIRLLLISCVALNAFGAAETSSSPGRLLVPLKPRYNKLSSKKQNHRRSGVISGLLVRQSCEPGYGGCSDGGCCPIGGDCCASGGCCDTGEWCYSDFCCLLSETGCDNKGCCDVGDNCCEGGSCCASSDYCAVVDGVQGCCEIGKTCTGSSNQCDKSGYSPCTNDNYCCPTGETCFRDSNNNPGCESGGGGGGGTTTTKKTTTTTPATTTTKGTTTTTTNLNTATAGGSAPSSAPSSAPAAPAGSENVVIDVSTELDITWTGDWVVVPSSCNSGSKAKKVSGNSTSFEDGIMSFSFTGTRVYVSVVSVNAQYTISIDSAETDYGSPSGATATPSNCTFGWSRTNLTAEEHFISISIFGAIDERRDIEAPWSLELQNLVITQPSSASVSLSGGQSSSTSSAKAGADGNLSAASMNSISWSLLVFTATMATISLYMM
ncbi:hypothetical protein MSAN_00513300 [Mycena sanguinolenta]|uniref:GPI anchored protein n=1 Tax=Mycena sanguinolenta TaxID=230812 RepID=A0A8H6Z667_9AGAR|nr:hypothetical protein MSAN_00513300 [Mycena sanguinolenta]